MPRCCKCPSAKKASRKTARKGTRKDTRKRRLMKTVKDVTGRHYRRPSARAVFDQDRRKKNHRAFYDGAWHVMKFRANGSPYWARA